MTGSLKPHSNRTGAATANRKGWIVIGGFMLIVAVFLAGLLARDDLSVGFVAAWAIAFIAAEFAFIWIAWKKTDGAWRWRRGSDDIGK